MSGWWMLVWPQICVFIYICTYIHIHNLYIHVINIITKYCKNINFAQIPDLSEIILCCIYVTYPVHMTTLLEALQSTLAVVKESVFLRVTSCPATKLGWGWALVSQHQLEGSSKVVGQRAAVSLLGKGQQDGQEQEEQEEQLKWQRCPAHSTQKWAHTSRAPLKDTNQGATQKNEDLGRCTSITSNCQEEGQNNPCLVCCRELKVVPKLFFWGEYFTFLKDPLLQSVVFLQENTADFPAEENNCLKVCFPITKQWLQVLAPKLPTGPLTASTWQRRSVPVTLLSVKWECWGLEERSQPSALHQQKGASFADHPAHGHTCSWDMLFGS